MFKVRKKFILTTIFLLFIFRVVFFGIYHILNFEIINWGKRIYFNLKYDKTGFIFNSCNIRTIEEEVKIGIISSLDIPKRVDFIDIPNAFFVERGRG